MRKFLLVILLFCHSIANADKIDDFFKAQSYDLVYGKEDAPIEVLEYYALTCPHCSHFYLHNFPNLKKEYVDTGKVRWIKRSYTADLPSTKATLLLGCVNKQHFENYLNILLSKQSNWAYQKDFLNVLSNIASLGGMSTQDFKKCIDNKQNEKILMERSARAREMLKISGTPSFFVNKEPLLGYSENSFKEAFDKILLKK